MTPGWQLYFLPIKSLGILTYKFLLKIPDHLEPLIVNITKRCKVFSLPGLPKGSQNRRFTHFREAHLKRLSPRNLRGDGAHFEDLPGARLLDREL